MLSKERAEFMINKLEKELSYLQERNDYVIKSGNVTLEKDNILFKIKCLKVSLSSFKDGLLQMVKNNTDSLDTDGIDLDSYKEFQEKKESYKGANSWDSFVENIEKKKVNYQKVNNYSQIKVRGM